MGVPDLAAALAIVGGSDGAGVSVEAAEAFFDDGLERVLAHTGLSRPVPPAPAYLLVEWEGGLEVLAGVAGDRR